MKDGYVYFILCPEVNRLKIGWSGNHPSLRMGMLANGSPVAFRLLALQSGTKADEKALHRRFRHLRVCVNSCRSEWFAFEPELIEFVRSEVAVVLDLPDGVERLPLPRELTDPEWAACVVICHPEGRMILAEAMRDRLDFIPTARERLRRGGKPGYVLGFD